MGQSVVELVDALRPRSSGYWFHKRRNLNMVYSYYTYWPRLTDNLSCGYGPIVEMDRLSSNIAPRLYIRYYAPDSGYYTFYDTSVPAASYRRTSRSTYISRYRAFFIEILLLFSFYSSFSNCFYLFKYNCNYLANTLRTGIVADYSSEEPSHCQQLFPFLFATIVLFNKRRLALPNRTAIRIVLL